LFFVHCFTCDPFLITPFPFFLNSPLSHRIPRPHSVQAVYDMARALGIRFV
jgi:hypothetical protein